MALNLNSKQARIEFDWLKTEVLGQIFEVVKVNRSSTKNGKPQAKIFCTAIGGEYDKKSVIKELVTTENNVKAIRDFAIACGRYEIRTDEDGEYKHVLIASVEQLVGTQFTADFVNKSTGEGFFGIVQNECEVKI